MRSQQKKMMDYCTYCPKMCRFSCPTAEATNNETYTPWGKMEAGGWLLDQTVSLTEQMAAVSYQCTNCLHCQVYCEHGNDVPSALAEVRKLAVSNYVAPAAAYDLDERFHLYNNPYGLDLLGEIRDRLPLSKKKRPEVLFFPSCHTLHYFPERILTYLNLFKKLQIPGVVVYQESIQCCGEPLDSLGFHQEFQEIAEVQYYSLKKYPLIVTDGPECCVSFKQKYAKLHLPLDQKVLHLLELIAPYLEAANYRTKGKAQTSVGYFDPVFLSRYLHLVEMPRKVIKEVTGFLPVELSMHGKDALSSGVEAGYDLIFPETSDKIAQRVIDEVSSREIFKLITACAKTEEKLRSLKPGFEIQDIFEFINEQIV
jgi:Fe-S oxidoreductase